MNKKINKLLSLGTTTDGDLTLTIKPLQRQFACFGSSGSGKTVASKVVMEELARGRAFLLLHLNHRVILQV